MDFDNVDINGLPDKTAPGNPFDSVDLSGLPDPNTASPSMASPAEMQNIIRDVNPADPFGLLQATGEFIRTDPAENRINQGFPVVSDIPDLYGKRPEGENLLPVVSAAMQDEPPQDFRNAALSVMLRSAVTPERPDAAEADLGDFRIVRTRSLLERLGLKARESASAGEVDLTQAAMDFFSQEAWGKVFGMQSPEKAMNVYALSQLHDIPIHIALKDYDKLNAEITGNVPPDEAAMRLGLVGLAAFGMVFPPAEGLTLATLGRLAAGAAYGIGTYEVIGHGLGYARDWVNGLPSYSWNPVSLSDLLPEEASYQTKVATELLDMYLKGKAAVAGYKGVAAAWDSLAHQAVELNRAPQSLFVSPEELAARFEGDPGAQQQFMSRMGISPAEWTFAREHGLTLEIPSATIVGKLDRPWWAKTKDAFRVSPYIEATVEFPPGETPVGKAGHPKTGIDRAPGTGEQTPAEQPLPPVQPIAGAGETPVPEITPSATTSAISAGPSTYKGEIPQKIVEAANRVGMDPNTALAIAAVESKFSPTIKNPNSSAMGIFQFIDSTWRDMGGTPADRGDVEKQITRGVQYLYQNTQALTKSLGHSPQPWELYIAHQQGADGATKLLSNPDARAADLVGEDKIVLNGGTPDMTAGQFTTMWRGKFENRLATVSGGAVPAPSQTRQTVADRAGRIYSPEDLDTVMPILDAAARSREETESRSPEEFYQLVSGVEGTLNIDPLFHGFESGGLPSVVQKFLDFSKPLLQSGDQARIDQFYGAGRQGKLADDFSRFVMEGVAPSVEMQGPFRKMRSWLLDTYKAFDAAHPDTVSDEVGAVLDRATVSDRKRRRNVVARMNDEYEAAFNRELSGSIQESQQNYRERVASPAESITMEPEEEAAHETIESRERRRKKPVGTQRTIWDELTRKASGESERQALPDSGGTDNWLGRRSQVKTLGKAFRDDLINKEQINYIGKKIRNPSELALLAQVWRDPRWETFRVVALKKGVVIHHEGVSQRLPGAVSIRSGPDTTVIDDVVAKYSPDQVYLIHNHPSGDPSPSRADVNLTVQAADKHPAVAGHIIINSGRYVLINRSGDYSMRDLPGMPPGEAVTDELLTPSIHNAYLGTWVTSVGDMVTLARALRSDQQGDGLTLIYFSAPMKVRGIQDAPRGILSDPERFKDFLREQLRSFGSTLVGIVDNRFEENEDFYKSLVDEGYAVDVVSADQKSLGRNPNYSLFAGKSPGQYPIHRVLEEPGPYNPETSALSTYDQIMALAAKRAWEETAKEDRKARRKSGSMFRREAETLYDEIPIVRAVRAAKAKGIRRSSLSDWDPDTVKRIMRRWPGLISNSGKMLLDEMAADYGFESADAVISELLNTPTRARFVENYAADALEATGGEQGLSEVEWQERLVRKEIEILNEMLQPNTRVWENRPSPGIKKMIEKMSGLTRAAEASGVSEYDALKAGLKKASAAARKAFSAGNRSGALREKIRQQNILAAYRAKLAARLEVKKIRTQMKGFLRAKIEPEFKDALVDLIRPYARNLGLGDRLDRYKGKVNVLSLIDMMETEGELFPVDKNEIFALRGKTWDSMTVDDLAQLRDIARTIVKFSKLRNRMLTQGRKVTLQNLAFDLATRAMMSAGGRGDRTPKTPIEKLQAKAEENLRPSAIRRFLYSLKKEEFLSRDLDGWQEFGPHHMAITRPVQQAVKREMALRDQIDKKLAGLQKEFKAAVGDIGKWFGKRVEIPGMPGTLTRQQVFMAYASMQNDANLQTLRSLFNDAQISHIRSLITDAERVFFEGHQKLFESLWPELSAVYRRLTGSRLKKVEGAYWPIVLDPELMVETEMIVSRSAVREMFQSAFESPSMPSGFTKERLGTGKPPNLDYAWVPKRLHDTAHWIAFAETVRDLQKLINQPIWANAVVNYRNRAFYDQYMEWLQDVANPRRELPKTALDRTLDVVRRNTTVHMLSLSVNTSLKHFWEWPLTITELGFFNTMRGFLSFYRAPIQTTKFVNDSSGQMAHAHQLWDRDVADVMSAIAGYPQWQRFLFAHAMDLLYLSDRMIRYPAWIEAYTQANEGSGYFKGEPQPHEKAVEYADAIVRRTKAMGGNANLPAMLRGRGTRRFFTIFGTWFATVHNQTWEKFNRARYEGKVNLSPKPFGWLDLVKAMFLIYVLTPIATETTVKRRLPNDAQEVGIWVSDYFMSQFPFYGQIWRAATLTIEHGGKVGDVDFQASPVFEGATQAAKALFDGYRAATGGNVSPDWYVHAAEAFGLAPVSGPLGGMPPRQAITFAKGLVDLATGRSETWWSLTDRSAMWENVPKRRVGHRGARFR